MRLHNQLIALLTVFASIGMASCGGRPSGTADGETILVSVGDSSLTVRDVEKLIPKGMTPDDSLALSKRITDQWIKSMILRDYMTNHPDVDERIERMTETYRDNLIISEYMSSRKGDFKRKVSENDIRSFYNSHAAEMMLENPIVKGIYLRVPDSAIGLPELRRWMRDAGESSIDNIEKYGLDEASQYEYFQDRWVDWESLATFIPYDFFDPDAFLASTRDFETSYGGNTYLLHISEYKSSGSKMPYEFARDQISEILYREKSRDFEKDVLRELYEDAYQSGLLKAGAYNPLKKQ